MGAARKTRDSHLLMAGDSTQKSLTVPNKSLINLKELPIDYKGVKLDCGYRVDLFIDDKLIVELKAVEKLLPIHEAQILTYMKLADLTALKRQQTIIGTIIVPQENKLII